MTPASSAGSTMSRARLRARGRRRKTSGPTGTNVAATDPAPVPRARSAAALRREPPPVRRPLPQHGTSKLVDDVVQHGGMELSYLNLYDADAAGGSSTRSPTSAGSGRGGQARQPVWGGGGGRPARCLRRCLRVRPYVRLWRDRRSFGTGGRTTGGDDGGQPKADVVIAPGYSDEALRLFATKRKNMRVLAAPTPRHGPRARAHVSGGWLVQTPVPPGKRPEKWQVVDVRPTQRGQLADLQLA